MTTTILKDAEKANFVSDIIDYGTDFVAPLYAVVESIEQAVLQSPEVQALRKDAGRYRYLSGRDDASATGVGCWLERNGEALECGWLYGDQLDATIDAAMEKQQ